MNQSQILSECVPYTHDGGITFVRILHDLESGKLVVPDYQRQFVWTDEQVGLYAWFVLRKGQAPPIWVQEYPGVETDELVDGLQRLTAFRMFLDGEKPAILDDGRRLWRHELAPDCNNYINGLHVTKKITRLERRSDVLKLYIMLNQGGSVHSSAEINRVKRMLAACTDVTAR